MVADAISRVSSYTNLPSRSHRRRTARRTSCMNTSLASWPPLPITMRSSRHRVLRLSRSRRQQWPSRWLKERHSLSRWPMLVCWECFACEHLYSTFRQPLRGSSTFWDHCFALEDCNVDWLDTKLCRWGRRFSGRVTLQYEEQNINQHFHVVDSAILPSVKPDFYSLGDVGKMSSR